jgi:hypothetical protein
MAWILEILFKWEQKKRMHRKLTQHVLYYLLDSIMNWKYVKAILKSYSKYFDHHYFSWLEIVSILLRNTTKILKKKIEFWKLRPKFWKSQLEFYKLLLEVMIITSGVPGNSSRKNRQLYLFIRSLVLQVACLVFTFYAS